MIAKTAVHHCTKNWLASTAEIWEAACWQACRAAWPSSRQRRVCTGGSNALQLCPVSESARSQAQHQRGGPSGHLVLIAPKVCFLLLLLMAAAGVQTASS